MSAVCPRCQLDWTRTISHAFVRRECKRCGIVQNEHGTFWSYSTARLLVWRPEHICEVFVAGDYIATRVAMPWLPFDISKEQLEKYLVLL